MANKDKGKLSHQMAEGKPGSGVRGEAPVIKKTIQNESKRTFSCAPSRQSVCFWSVCAANFLS